MPAADLTAVQLGPGVPFALAFRGYNQTNLGRTPELLGHDAYRPIVEHWLRWADTLCERHANMRTDLVGRVERREDPPPDRYAEAVALVFATEMAQIDLARQVHGVDIADARLAIGYSLGELVALAAGGFVSPEAVLSVPLSLAADCAALSADTKLFVAFSRSKVLPFESLRSACQQLSSGERGVALSAVLSPNTALLIGHDDLVARLPKVFPELRGIKVHPHDGVWPPLHTPLVRRAGVCDRAQQMIQSTTISASGPTPPIFSLVTGRMEYADGLPRQVLAQWTDHPQLLWNGVTAILASDVRRVVHIGPEPNVIPATFARLAANVQQQIGAPTARGLGLRTFQSLVDGRWLASILPLNANLLRAPMIEHVVLEDWLLAHAPASDDDASSGAALADTAVVSADSSSDDNRSATASTALR